jgi:hypothetical protein
MSKAFFCTFGGTRGSLIDELHVLRPQDVPTSDVSRVALGRSFAEEISGLSFAEKTWDSNESAARDVRARFAALPSGEAVAAPPLREDEAIHDRFFHVARVDGCATELFFRSVVAGHVLFLDDLAEIPFDVAPDVLDRIDDAFKALESRSLGTAVASGRRVAVWKSANGPRRSLDRWIRGHQIFAVLTQGLIAAFRDVRAALGDVDAPGLDAAVDFAELVLRGAGASLEFTGDLPSEDYLTIVRPSMAPPNVPETFSGLFSADHRYFVALLREMAPQLEALGERRPEHHARLAAGLGAVYDGHKFVCERLVGRSPSLMMMSGITQKSGVEQIEEFKKRRMKAFERPTLQTGATASS